MNDISESPNSLRQDNEVVRCCVRRSACLRQSDRTGSYRGIVGLVLGYWEKESEKEESEVIVGICCVPP